MVRSTTAWREIRPDAETAIRHRGSGWWRNETYLDDLASAGATAGDRTAIVSARTGRAGAVCLTYRELDHYARRFAHGLQALGIGPGDVVAYYLPNWWEAAALTYACGWAGAIAAPSPMWFTPTALEHLWPDVQPALCLVPERWNAVPYAEMLADMAKRMPSLRHRVVIGDAGPTGAIDFRSHFLDTDRENISGHLPGLDADQVAMVVFTSATTGRAQAVLHTPNTLYAGALSAFTALPPVPDGAAERVLATTSPLTHISGLQFGITGPVLGHHTVVITDDTQPDTLYALCAQYGATDLVGAPQRLHAIAEAGRATPRATHLRTVVSLGDALPPAWDASIRDALCPRVLNAWGSTQTGGATMTGPKDPTGWATHSIGRPTPGVEIDDRPSDDEPAAVRPLRVRGPGVCVATFHRDGEGVHVLPPGGWHDTGDLVSADGRGGLRYQGRGAAQVGGPFLPLHELENHLLAHPAIRDVALVDLTPPGQSRFLYAVIVPESEPPTLDEVCRVLTGLGLNEHTHPQQVAYATELPRTAMGKLRRRDLTDWLLSDPV